MFANSAKQTVNIRY